MYQNNANSSSDDNDYPISESDIDPSTLPSASEQVSIIKEFDRNERLVPGENAYAISKKWVVIWKESVGYEDGEPQGRIAPRIDNRNIFDPKTEFLKADAYEEYDYLIITKKPWEQLMKWYPGGPEIPIEVVQNPVTKKAIAVIKKIKIIAKFKDETKEFKTHTSELVSVLKEKILKEFGVEINDDNKEEYRLIDYWNKSFREVMDDDYTINKYNIMDNNDIFVDYQTDGKWKYEKKTDNYYHNSSYSNSGGYSYGYGNSYYYGTPLGPGKCGLSNLGNTCFFNSGIQCLMHSVPLKNALLGPNWENDINKTNPLGMKGKLARAFQSLLAHMWSGNERVLTPTDLKYVTGEFAQQFSGWGQQDSHELITFILDGIHEDLNRCLIKENVDRVIGDASKDDLDEIAKQSWIAHLKRNDSIIVDNFQAQYMSKLLCPRCEKTTVVFDPYMAISIPLSKPHQKTLDVTFVPYDFSETFLKLSLVLPASPQQKDFDKSISEQLQKDIHVAIGMSSYYYGQLSWKVDFDNGTPQFFAFEIPDLSKLYIPASINMNIKSHYSNWNQEKRVSPYFIIAVDNDDPTQEEIIEALSQKLNCLWSDNEATNEFSESDFVNSVIDYDSNNVDKDCKFGYSKLSSDYWNRSSSFKRNPKHEFLSDTGLNVFINYQLIDKRVGFSFSVLRQNYDFGNLSNSYDRDSHHSHSVTLNECFDFFRASETLDEENQWFCPHCRQHVCAQKKMDIYSVPNCFIIHLKRFSSGKYTTQKDDVEVEYPDIIDMKNYVIGPQKNDKNLEYELYAVSEHMGGLGGGHYTAHALVREKLEEQGEWYSFNDSSCSASSKDQAHNSSAYILFYQRKECRD